MSRSETHVSETSLRPKVLVVDDDPHIRRLLSTLLRRAGIEADTASDGGEALEKIRSSGYELVLLDLMMPRVDGFQVLDELNTLAESKPSVVVVSACPASHSVEGDCVKEIVDKPFEITTLLEIVRRTLGFGNGPPLTA